MEIYCLHLMYVHKLDIAHKNFYLKKMCLLSITI